MFSNVGQARTKAAMLQLMIAPNSSRTLHKSPMCVSSEAAFAMRVGLSVGEAEQPSPSKWLHAAS